MIEHRHFNNYGIHKLSNSVLSMPYDTLIKITRIECVYKCVLLIFSVSSVSIVRVY